MSAGIMQIQTLMRERCVNTLPRDTDRLELPMPLNCSIPNCPKPHYARTWCKMHYERWQRTGTTTAAPTLTVEQRFWSKVAPADESGCRRWLGQVSEGGYGYFAKHHGKKVLAHRFAFELVCPIPEGLHLDHLCRTRDCVNWAHLEPVTLYENLRRGNTDHNKYKTHCVHGHAFDTANTHVDSRGFRHCRACDRIAHQRKRDERLA